MFGSFPKFHKRNISTEIILKLGCNFCRRATAYAGEVAFSKTDQDNTSQTPTSNVNRLLNGLTKYSRTMLCAK